MGFPTYASREAIKLALENYEAAYNNGRIDEALHAATGDVNGLLRRVFYPRLATLQFPWPDIDSPGPSAIWLGENEELVSVVTLTSGGTVIAASDYYLEPVNQGPPYNRIEINRSTNAAFVSSGSGQRSIQVNGLTGYTNVTTPAGALAEALDDSETGVDVTDSAAVGVGDLLLVESERMIVTEKTMLTTGQTLQTPLTASNADVSVAVTTGSAYAVGEIILLDAERMRIVDIAGNTLIVRRAWDGTVLAAHAGSTIYAPRTLTVERGALGTTAAAHLTALSVSRHVFPSLVSKLARAIAIDGLLQDSAGWARVAGSGEAERQASNRSIEALREQAMQAHGRQSKHAAV